MVTITVMNCASSEPHGFAIGHYFNSGVTLGEGQRYIVTFQANTVGKFSVYCNVLCAIHPYMQNGLLIVS
jgi:heme/copper-type cytochrome/quinol oxidase subunit 2